MSQLRTLLFSAPLIVLSTIVMGTLFHRANTTTVAQKYAARAPSRLEVTAPRRAIAPLMPAPAKLAK